MTPLEVLSYIVTNPDSYSIYLPEEEKFKEEHAIKFLDAYVEILRSKKDREYQKKNRGKKLEERRKELESYHQVFSILGVLDRYSPVQKLMLREAAKRFPDGVIEEVENDYDTAEILVSYFEGCILPILFAGGKENHRISVSEKTGDKTGQYGYIPSNLQMLAELYVAKDPYLMKGKKFIDIGCGIGDKAIFVHMLQIPCEGHGLEYDYINVGFAVRAIEKLSYTGVANYCSVCGKILVHEPKRGTVCVTPNCRDAKKGKYRRKLISIWRADAFLSSFTRYDRLYTYSPIAQAKYRKEMYDHIWRNSNPEAQWLEVMSYDEVHEVGKKLGKVTTRTFDIEFRTLRFFSLKTAWRLIPESKE